MGAQDQKNGNIGQVVWRVRGRERQTYGFQYDFLDRLTSATFDEISESGSLRGKNWYSTSYQYDPRGNIDYLNRKGVYWDGVCWQVGTIDSLHMTQKWGDSNRYRRIRDLAPSASKDYGFRQTNSALNAYQYDANGNLTFDLNKNMDVVYNYLNLPERIEFDDCKVIEFTYDANGIKLRKELKNGAMLLSTHDYLGSIEYKGSELEAIYHEEGRVYYEGGTGRYEYNIRDHLGNTRLTFTDKDGDGVIEISDDAEVSEVLQENHYYPFGMAMDGQWMANAGREDKYQYNGKEFNDDFGLNWYDYGARWYMPDIGRWGQVDPLADEFSS